ncbi:DUF6092 family protein [Streptomyces bambusae]|uniref:DUF6092 family protein n=1 Tax=Streptomyces bambusae TaxID=1550616 RepID=UPI001CFC75B4|nr:DUF6092 family protein [Streptomyces bambusae]MCB5164657.1 DUF6092 family protein [Streptomyces bambusae]
MLDTDPASPTAGAPGGPGTEPVLVLPEDDAVELLAYLVTAARIQLDEAPENGPKRLLTAAGRLAEMIGPRVGDGLRPLIAEVRRQADDTAVQAGDPEAYAAQVDDLCRTLAAHLAVRLGLAEAAVP